VRVQLTTFERKTRAICVIGAGDVPVRKQRPVYPPQESSQTTFVGRTDNDNSGTFGRWEPTIVEIVAVECQERASKLPCETIVLRVSCPTELIVLEHKEDVPLEPDAHEVDKSGGDICIRIHAGLRRQSLGVWAEFR
jgi:hypothetical protein